MNAKYLLIALNLMICRGQVIYLLLTSLNISLFYIIYFYIKVTSLVINTSYQQICLQKMSKKICLASTTMEPSGERVYLHTTFYKPQIDSLLYQPELLLAEIYLMTPTQSYCAKLKRKNINRELTFNGQLLSRLESTFQARTSLIVGIQNRAFQKIVTFSTEFESRSMRVSLFETDLTPMTISPFQLMRQLMKTLTEEKELTLACLKVKEEQQREKYQQLNCSLIELVNQQKVLINTIQDKGIPLINKVKHELSRHFNLDQGIYTLQTQEQNTELQIPIKTKDQLSINRESPRKPLEQMEVDDLFK